MREKASAELDVDKEIITAAGDAVMKAEAAVAEIVLGMQGALEDKLEEAMTSINSAMDEARTQSKLDSEAMFAELRKGMGKVAALGGAEPFEDNWWEAFQQQFAFLKTLWDAADADESGSINCDELKALLEDNDDFMEALGGSLTGVTAEDIFDAIDSGGGTASDGEVSYAEFVAFASAAEFLPAFKSADADGSNSLSMDELKQVLVSMGYVDDGDVEAFITDDVFAKFDTDGSGEVSFGEFAEALVEIKKGEDE